MVWPANGKILYSSPTNPSDTYRAQTTELFANSYIRLRQGATAVQAKG